MAFNLTQQLQFINSVLAIVDPYTSVTVSPSCIVLTSIHKEGSYEFLHEHGLVVARAKEMERVVLHVPSK